MELQIIQSKIHDIRGYRVMLDSDLAELYGVETSQLKRAVRRNIERFEGDDFMFELTQHESNNLKFNTVCQNGISKRGGTQYAPFAFTELGVAMLSSVLNSQSAIEINRNIMRAFVTIRNAVLHLSPSGEIKELKGEIKDLKEYVEEILSDMNDISEETRRDIDDIHIALAEMASKSECKKPRRRIGFVRDEE